MRVNTSNGERERRTEAVEKNEGLSWSFGDVIGIHHVGGTGNDPPNN